MALLKQPHVLLEAAFALRSAKRAAVVSPHLVPVILKKLEKQPFFAPYISQAKTRLERTSVALKRLFPNQEVGETFAVSEDELAALVRIADPNLAKKLRLSFPEYTVKNWRRAGKVHLLPWGAHAVFDDPEQFHVPFPFCDGRATCTLPPLSFGKDDPSVTQHEIEHLFSMAVIGPETEAAGRRVTAYHRYLDGRLPPDEDSPETKALRTRLRGILLEDVYLSLQDELQANNVPTSDHALFEERMRKCWGRFRRAAG